MFIVSLACCLVHNAKVAGVAVNNIVILTNQVR